MSTHAANSVSPSTIRAARAAVENATKNGRTPAPTTQVVAKMVLPEERPEVLKLLKGMVDPAQAVRVQAGGPSAETASKPKISAGKKRSFLSKRFRGQK